MAAGWAAGWHELVLEFHGVADLELRRQHLGTGLPPDEDERIRGDRAPAGLAVDRRHDAFVDDDLRRLDGARGIPVRVGAARGPATRGGSPIVVEGADAVDSNRVLIEPDDRDRAFRGAGGSFQCEAIEAPGPVSQYECVVNDMRTAGARLDTRTGNIGSAA